MAQIKANEALVKALQAWDIDHLYGIPGDSIDAVVDSLRTVRDQFKFYHVRHEEVASLAAGSYTKMTGKIGVALSIGGPGLVHLLNGMYDAKMDKVPQLILSGQTNSTLLGTKAFQETNLSKLCEDVAVYNHQIQKGDNVFEIVNEAIRTAYEKKGVAVLILPNNLLNNKVKDTTSKGVDTAPPARVAPKPRSVKKATKLINKSKRPVMLLGTGAKHAKDEVRELGIELGIPEHLVWRQPFPGPGLGIRVLGEITEDKLEIVRESDAILRQVIREEGLEREIWQYFTVLPGIQSVGVMGDYRTYDHTVGIRAVTSIDGMTSDFARIDWEVLQKISSRIVNEVDHVNRVVYDITSKPPSTIEWE